MATIGLSESIPNKHIGPPVNLIPIRFFPHEPETINKKFPVGQVVILSKNPTSGNEGDLWYLSKFTGGDPIWLPLSGGGSGPTISISDTANTKVYADGTGNIQLTSSTLSIVSDPVNNRIAFAFPGGGQAIESFIVPAGTSPVVPDSNGQVTFNIGTGLTLTGGTNEFTLELTGGGISIDSIGVQGTSGAGTNPVVADSNGNINFEGALVAAGTNPLRVISTAANTAQWQIQTSQASASPDPTKNGLSHYSSAHFGIDAEGFVTSLGNQVMTGVINIGFSYNSGTGTFTVHGQDGTALSSSNPGYITLQDPSTHSNLKTIEITANQDFIDDAGSSEIIGNLFGLTTGVATTVDVPFYLYAVINDAADSIAFMISRLPCMSSSPSSANIGMPSTPAADNQQSFFSFENVTAANYDSNPCLCIGSFRMRMSASDDWTVQTLASKDGIGQFQEGIGFTFPRGQFGAASSKYILNNGGTAPNDTNGNYVYFIEKSGKVNIYLALPSMTTAGVGAVDLKVALPFITGNGGTIVMGYYLDGTNTVTVTGDANAAAQSTLVLRYTNLGSANSKMANSSLPLSSYFTLGGFYYAYTG